MFVVQHLVLALCFFCELGLEAGAAESDEVLVDEKDCGPLVVLWVFRMGLPPLGLQAAHYNIGI